MALTKKEQREITSKILLKLGLFVMILLAFGGVLAWKGYVFTTSQVREGLAEQKIYFPQKGSPALDPEEYPNLQKYAGQLVDDGPKAKAYANEYIGSHLKAVADGKTYSEVSTEARKDPDNKELAAQKQTLFQGETLRGLLLTAGYSYWTIGMMLKYSAMVMFGGVLILAVLTCFGLAKQKFSSKK